MNSLTIRKLERTAAYGDWRLVVNGQAKFTYTHGFTQSNTTEDSKSLTRSLTREMSMEIKHNGKSMSREMQTQTSNTATATYEFEGGVTIEKKCDNNP
jgi:hypothetical protein